MEELNPELFQFGMSQLLITVDPLAVERRNFGQWRVNQRQL